MTLIFDRLSRACCVGLFLWRKWNAVNNFICKWIFNIWVFAWYITLYSKQIHNKNKSGYNGKEEIQVEHSQEESRAKVMGLLSYAYVTKTSVLSTVSNNKKSLRFSLLWEAISQIESCGLNVLTDDGASPDRCLFKIHQASTSSALRKGIAMLQIRDISSSCQIHHISSRQ